MGMTKEKWEIFTLGDPDRLTWFVREAKSKKAIAQLYPGAKRTPEVNAQAIAQLPNVVVWLKELACENSVDKPAFAGVIRQARALLRAMGEG